MGGEVRGLVQAGPNAGVVGEPGGQPGDRDDGGVGVHGGEA